MISWREMLKRCSAKYAMLKDVESERNATAGDHQAIPGGIPGSKAEGESEGRATALSEVVGSAYDRLRESGVGYGR